MQQKCTNQAIRCPLLRYSTYIIIINLWALEEPSQVSRKANKFLCFFLQIAKATLFINISCSTHLIIIVESSIGT